MKHVRYINFGEINNISNLEKKCCLGIKRFRWEPGYINKRAMKLNDETENIYKLKIFKFAYSIKKLIKNRPNKLWKIFKYRS